MAIFFIERAILIFANAIIEPFFSRIEQKNALSGYFYKRHPVDYKIFIFLGQPLFYEPDQLEPFSGMAQKLFDNGTLHTALSFKNGLLHGDETRYFHNGRKGYVRRWQDGKMDGLWEEWHRNARKDFEIYFKDGVRHGNETYFSRNGREAQVRIWENGKMISGWSNYALGEILPNSEMDTGVME